MKNIKIFKSEKRKKTALNVFSALVALSASSALVFADPMSSITNLVNTVSGWLTGIVIGVGILAFTAAGIIRMISKNPRTAEEATEWMKRVAITTALVGAAGMIINYMSGILKN